MTLPSLEDRARLPLRRVVGDAALIAQRNLRRLSRSLQAFTFSLIQPIFQLVLFAYILGSLVSFGGNVSYTDFVVPAVILQTLGFVAVTTGIAIALDLQTGMVERLRALPIARSAFLVGRLMSDSVRLAILAVLLTCAGLVIGFRFDNGLAGALGMILVAIAFGVVITALSGLVALTVRRVETVSNALLIPILPLIFTSSAFAPISRLPGWLQPIARLNPTTSFVDTARGLALGEDALAQVSDVSLGASAVRSVLWFTGIMAVSTTVAVRRYANPFGRRGKRGVDPGSPGQFMGQ